MHIQPDDLRHPQTIALLEAHRRSMFDHSPPESVHALDLDGLRKPEITFWSAWEGDALLGCGAFRELNAKQGFKERPPFADYAEDPFSVFMRLDLGALN